MQRSLIFGKKFGTTTGSQILLWVAIGFHTTGIYTMDIHWVYFFTRIKMNGINITNKNSMTAKIKFRGFRTDGKGWVIGLPRYCESDNSWGIEWWENGTRFLEEIHPSSLGMFTGLTDKNGKEIYGAIGEKGGDVVQYKGGKKERGKQRGVVTSFVVFRNGMFTVDKNESILHDFAVLVICEIIGNQWEVDNGK